MEHLPPSSIIQEAAKTFLASDCVGSLKKGCSAPIFARSRTARLGAFVRDDGAFWARQLSNISPGNDSVHGLHFRQGEAVPSDCDPPQVVPRAMPRMGNLAGYISF
jgi:hypothetical protein